MTKFIIYYLIVLNGYIGKKHALKKYDQFAFFKILAGFFCGNTHRVKHYPSDVQFHKKSFTNIMNESNNQLLLEVRIFL